MKKQIESSQAIVTALLCTFFALALLTQSCSPIKDCAANDKGYFYRHEGVKQFKAVDQNKCFKFKN